MLCTNTKPPTPNIINGKIISFLTHQSHFTRGPGLMKIGLHFTLPWTLQITHVLSSAQLFYSLGALLPVAGWTQLIRIFSLQNLGYSTSIPHFMISIGHMRWYSGPSFLLKFLIKFLRKLKPLLACLRKIQFQTVLKLEWRAPSIWRQFQ